jgi:ribonuclease BN (tRNA processing enzyme)
MDHVSGLPDFIWGEIWNSRGQRTRPLNITGPEGLHDFWYKRFIPFFSREIPFQVNLHELSDGVIYNKSFCQVKAVKLKHSEDSTAYLVTAGSVKIAFTGDTGICEPLIELINSADIAVCEWSFTEKSPSDSHLGGEEIKMLLEKTSQCSSIYFTHMFPETGCSYKDLINKRVEKLNSTGKKIHFPEDLYILNIEADF